ncbi:hypothetical protein ElyMa_001540200 [Elysia marginata]|uniref:Uncharacterized protein n=1 Tax=Elysia marginata TaxID=1093978 RepID=A0AAV4JF59_9GAST|nr:hypothetical protein ElyMa_001540200 [Elysia marginata]
MNELGLPRFSDKVCRQMAGRGSRPVGQLATTQPVVSLSKSPAIVALCLETLRPSDYFTVISGALLPISSAATANDRKVLDRVREKKKDCARAPVCHEKGTSGRYSELDEAAGCLETPTRFWCREKYRSGRR